MGGRLLFCLNRPLPVPTLLCPPSPYSSPLSPPWRFVYPVSGHLPVGGVTLFSKAIAMTGPNARRHDPPQGP